MSSHGESPRVMTSIFGEETREMMITYEHGIVSPRKRTNACDEEKNVMTNINEAVLPKTKCRDLGPVMFRDDSLKV